MTRKKRVLLMAISVVVMAAIVTGIALLTADIQEPEYNPGLYDGKTQVDTGAPALQVGDYQISFMEYRHYYLLYQNYMQDYYYVDFENDPDGDYAYMLRQMVEVELANMYALIDLAAQEGVTLDEDDLAEITQQIDSQKEEYGSAYATQLESMYFTSEEAYRDVAEKQRLAQKMQDLYTEELEEANATRIGNQADKDYDAAYISAKHILVIPDEEADSTVAQQEALAIATGLLSQIKGSNDPEAKFDELMNEYSEDPGLANYPDGYTFKEGDMVTEFYEAALALEEGEVSEPVKSSNGYHIIMRIPLLQADKDANRTTAISTAINEMVTEKLEALQKAMPLTRAAYYDYIKPGSVK